MKYITFVKIFVLIGPLVLLIACINFINLSTARSEKRAREVGVRKAVGSSRSQFVLQFLTESVMIVFFVAFIISLLLVQLVLPAFNQKTSSAIKVPYTNVIFWLVMLAYILSTGLIAGRPAFYISSFKPVKVLKGTLVTGERTLLPRKVLVVLQLTCSVSLIIGTVIIYRQVQYARNRPASGPQPVDNNRCKC